MTPTERDIALAELASSHDQRLVRFVFGMIGDMAAAEDLAQDALLRAHERWYELENPNRAVPWLYAIARNNARMHLRRRERWTWLPWRDRFVPTQDPLNANAEDADQVWRVMSVLNDDDREVLLLVGMGGFTAAEAADAIGISTAAMHKRWQRACQRFREVTKEHDDDAL